eukprot:200676-Chlamydomonas_euryale.AAC.9
MASGPGECLAACTEVAKEDQTEVEEPLEASGRSLVVPCRNGAPADIPIWTVTCHLTCRTCHSGEIPPFTRLGSNRSKLTFSSALRYASAASDDSMSGRAAAGTRSSSRRASSRCPFATLATESATSRSPSVTRPA